MGNKHACQFVFCWKGINCSYSFYDMVWPILQWVHCNLNLSTKFLTMPFLSFRSLIWTRLFNLLKYFIILFNQRWISVINFITHATSLMYQKTQWKLSYIFFNVLRGFDGVFGDKMTSALKFVDLCLMFCFYAFPNLDNETNLKVLKTTSLEWWDEGLTVLIKWHDSFCTRSEDFLRFYPL